MLTPAGILDATAAAFGVNPGALLQVLLGHWAKDPTRFMNLVARSSRTPLGKIGKPLFKLIHLLVFHRPPAEQAFESLQAQNRKMQQQLVIK